MIGDVVYYSSVSVMLYTTSPLFVVAVTTCLREGLRGLGDWGPASYPQVAAFHVRSMVSAATSAIHGVTRAAHVFSNRHHGVVDKDCQAFAAQSCRRLCAWLAIHQSALLVCTCACWMQHLNAATHAAVFAERAVVRASFASWRKNQPRMRVRAHSSLHAVVVSRINYIP